MLQDVEIVVHPIPRIVSNWLIGIGKLLSTLIALKVLDSSLATPACCIQKLKSSTVAQSFSILKHLLV